MAEENDAGAWRERAVQAERELALRRAVSGVDWFDAEDALRELAGRAEQDAEGQWRVRSVLPPAEGAEPARLNPGDAARELAERKPHWVRAKVLAGTGAGGSGTGNAGGAGNTGVSYAELLRPENAARLREYIRERPEELERLRTTHFRG